MQDSSPAARWVPFPMACLVASVMLGSPGHGMQDCRVPTAGTEHTVTQPNGKSIQVYFRGNGFNHWYEDINGFPVIETPGGWMYARLTSTRRLTAAPGAVGASDPVSLGIVPGTVPAPSIVPARHSARAAGPGSPPPAFSMSTGTIKNLVILVRFSDHGPGGQDRTLPSSADVDTIMNAVGGDPTLAPTGSVRDYYLEASYGALTINSTVVGWLDMPETEAATADGSSGATTFMEAFILNALDMADPLVDFSDFDDDGDGFIDMLTFLHSGYAAEWGGDDFYGTNYASRIWSHKGDVSTWTSAEGIQVSDYNISPGLWFTSGSDPGRIGVVCHELGHFLGMPDLYDTDGSSIGAGNWCLMASGSWGFAPFETSQQYPSHMSAWCKVKLGWVTPQLLLPGTHSALQVETNPEVYKLDSGYPPGEYLLIENRQPVGFEALIPQGGLAIWHIDEGKGTLTSFSVNTDEGFPGQAGWPGNNNHYRIALLEADGDYDLELWNNPGDATDPYHSGLTPLIDWLSTPDTNAYQGGALVVNENRIQGIGPSSASIPFTYSNTARPLLVTVSTSNAFVGLPFFAVIPAIGDSPPLAWSEYIPDPSYTLTGLGPQPFVMDGSPLGFTGAGTFSIELPFAFPYYETRYSSIRLTSNGCIDLVPLEFEYSNNSTSFLRSLPRIAGLWDGFTPGDIYANATASSWRFRWEGTNGGQPVNFAITLHDDGRIRFDYGAGNIGLSPTVGISRGQGGELEMAGTHDGQSTLTDASSLEFTLIGSQLPPGLVLSQYGFLSGTATTPGLYEYCVRVTDSDHRYDQKLIQTLVRTLHPGVHPAPAKKQNPAAASIRLP